MTNSRKTSLEPGFAPISGRLSVEERRTNENREGDHDAEHEGRILVPREEDPRDVGTRDRVLLYVVYWFSCVLFIGSLRKKHPVSLDGLMNDEDHAPLDPADTRPLASEVLQQHEQAERVSAALVGIPAEYRETVVLRFQEGLALNEIATITGAPLGTVKSRLYRGLNMLMSRLKGAQA